MRRFSFAGRVLGGLAAASLLVGDPGAAQACSIPGPAEHVLDPAEEAVDTTAPSVPLALEYKLDRGDPSQNGCLFTGFSINSCGGIGTLAIIVTPGTDDRTAPELLGYRVELVAGSMRVLNELDVALAGPYVDFTFSDEGDSDIDATFAVRAVDLAGNESEPVLIHVTDNVWSSCSLGGRRSRHGLDASPWLVLLAIATTIPLRRRFLS